MKLSKYNTYVYNTFRSLTLRPNMNFHKKNCIFTVIVIINSMNITDKSSTPEDLVISATFMED